MIYGRGPPSPPTSSASTAIWTWSRRSCVTWRRAGRAGLDLTLATDARPGPASGRRRPCGGHAGRGRAGHRPALDPGRAGPHRLPGRADRPQDRGRHAGPVRRAYGGLNSSSSPATTRSRSAPSRSRPRSWRRWSARWCWPGRETAAPTTASCAARSTGSCSGSERSLASLKGLKALAEAMRDALLAGDLATFAEGLRQGWDARRSRHRHRHPAAGGAVRGRPPPGRPG